MKRIRFVQFLGILFFVTYIILFIVDLLRGVLGDYKDLIFSLFLSLIGINLILKGVLIKSNSTLWFANVLITLSLTIVLLELFELNIVDYYYLFTIIPILASVINLIVFKNLIYVKVIIINITVIIPTILQFLNKFNLYLAMCVFVISILVGVLICRLINFDKEKV